MAGCDDRCADVGEKIDHAAVPASRQGAEIPVAGFPQQNIEFGAEPFDSRDHALGDQSLPCAVEEPGAGRVKPADAAEIEHGIATHRGRREQPLGGQLDPSEALIVQSPRGRIVLFHQRVRWKIAGLAARRRRPHSNVSAERTVAGRP